ncbi:protein AF-9 isoform X3 [Bombyx mori]|uniref:YEATS domain-containing protein n=1 Tax=Bombyx mori TaxID=7091 RepID=A0A8R2AKC6_BOMMO|nr:protein AF-9 isoform X3 [Bombyx mori]
MNTLVFSTMKMCVRIWLEVGHACEPRRSALGRALALDWRVWVRGANGRDISAFVHKIVFRLHPSSAFVYPKRVLQEPPYEIQESGCASIEIPIQIYLKYSSRPKKIQLKYSLQIENNTKSSSESRCIYYDFEKPSEQLCRALMSGGGELIARARAKHLLELLSGAGTKPPRKMNTNKFVEPVLCKHGSKKRSKRFSSASSCPKCGESTTAEIRKQLRAVEMTDDEILQVSRLYISYTSYEKSANALELPPPSDPIYAVPELPARLREALKAAEIDRTSSRGEVR